ncbi:MULTISPECIES: serine hydrolase domain-containing protein [unclassified Solwaraspora]|uniref:serine hydrolase domain-containing protein n=1 Tax=unclassified Solwaraspora TaxID=2627926 RepID=UPI00248A9CB8|nr:MULTISPECIES: serine hydrolase domain-containing protein [unclassified Solwaraspora]WBC19699.1 serine hydrolase [Solwaraspora sp. WMMA2080]WJK32711.1 serine hydrolase domain-containing protein [Solwaraspora sp. WMMA2065]
MPVVNGTVAPGYEPVQEAFLANFETRSEVGAAVSVYRHGQEVVCLWGGVADPTTGNAWRRDNLQLVYSATKSAAVTCAHLLAQRGQLDLDAPVAGYWPEFAAAGKSNIPVRWLLSHQAGLPVLDRPVPLEQALAWGPVVAALAAQAPAWRPGTAHGYHGLTYGWLVGEVVRRVSGRSLGTYFADEIAKPLGLDFWIGLPDTEAHRVARTVEQPATPPVSEAVPEQLRQVLAAYTDPTSLVVRSMTVTDPPIDLTDPRTWAAEIPAVNGICTASSLARFYAGLIGEVDGIRILYATTLAAATREQANGIDQVLMVPTRPALGFGLPLPEQPWWSPTAFGFPGHGGSLGYADPASGIAFGYVTNGLRVTMGPDPRTTALVQALRDAVSRQPD